MSGEFYRKDGQIRFRGQGVVAGLPSADDEVLDKMTDVLNKYMAPWYARYVRDRNIASQYESGQTPADIAEGLNVSPPTVYHALRRLGVDRRGGPRGPKPDRPDEDYLAKYNELRNYAAVGEHFGVSRQRAHQRIKRARAARAGGEE